MTQHVDDPKLSATSDFESVELLISRMLRLGVVVSITTVLCGIGVSLLRHPDYLRDPKTLVRLTSPGAAFPHTPGDLLRELQAARGRAIVTVGLLLLIMTPVARVAACVIAFVWYRDWIFSVLTTIVLVLLILSFALGKIG